MPCQYLLDHLPAVEAAQWAGQRGPRCLTRNVDARPATQTLAPRRAGPSQPCCPPFTDGLMASGVRPLHNYCLVSFPKRVMGVCSAPRDAAVRPARAHTCTLPPPPRRAWATGSAALCPLLKPRRPLPHPSSLQLPLPPTHQVPSRTSRPFSALPFWVFQEDEEENTSVNSMFLGCLIKRDKTAEELRAGLAGVGSHALLPRAAASG